MVGKGEGSQRKPERRNMRAESLEGGELFQKWFFEFIYVRLGEVGMGKGHGVANVGRGGGGSAVGWVRYCLAIFLTDTCKQVFGEGSSGCEIGHSGLGG